MGRVFLKRIYEPPLQVDGDRLLVERLWPRGVSKADAALDAWLKDIAPSGELRRWYDHLPERWPEFTRRYEAELAGKRAIVDDLVSRLAERDITLVFAARDERRNSAVVLKSVIEDRLRGLRRAKPRRASRPCPRARASS
ncbi:MAG: DUF488 family protein [Rhodospirillales bacterium]|nr:DUF488 family protein [Rhodospirillales bacterium]